MPDDTSNPSMNPPDGGGPAGETPSGAGDPAPSRESSLEAQLEESIRRGRETAERLKETHERLLRTAAEFDNYRKRAMKEKDDVRKYGSESLLKDFLPVMDNLERALDHAGQHDPKQVIEGVKLVQKHENGSMVTPEELIERAKDAPPREPREERPRGGDRRGGPRGRGGPRRDREESRSE